MQDVAFIVYATWRSKPSGVASFIGHMQELCKSDRINFEVVEIPDVSSIPERPAASSGTARGTADIEPRRAPRLRILRLALGYGRELGANMRLLWSLRSRLRGKVLVTNEFGCETLPIAIRLCFPRARTVAIVHTHPGSATQAGSRLVRSIEKTVHWCASELVYNSRAVKKAWEEKLGVKDLRGTVIYYGIEAPGPAVPADYPAKEAGTVDFLCVSRVVYWKGHRNLLDAWYAARDTCRCRIRLIILGDGPALGETVAHARLVGLAVADMRGEEANPLSADAVVLGARPHAAGYFAMADVGILLSTEPEAFGQVFLEASAREKPVIGSRIGGISEAVAERESGILVDPFSTDEAAAAICRLAESSDLRREMGGCGRERWAKDFTVDRMRADYEAYFSGQAR